MVLLNKKGLTMIESINEDIKWLSLCFSNDEFCKSNISVIRGKINCAYEFGLISESEWELYIEKIILLSNYN